ncbi:glycosyltransferase [Jannaschia rubra]|uniref:glycosyltransferase n=1 Tax=Jannaschia rubra TaxID=282197 RepID=UPI002492443A|nr:glycosyltransferase [Jannaschia rubra]
MTTPQPMPPKKQKRVAVFASYSPDGVLPPQVLPYLAGLRPLVEAIVVVCDNDLAPGERAKLDAHADHVIAGRHGEYDFGSYKRGVALARETGLLDRADALILCNDSCYGPVGSFAPMFETMEARGLDFWGGTDSHQFSYHLQSYFVAMTRPVFTSDAFRGFIEGVTKQESVNQVIQNYELGLTKVLREAGFTAGAMVENTLKGVHPKDPSYHNLPILPLYTLERGLPLVKVKALRISHTNIDGQNRLLAWLKENAPDIYDAAISDPDVHRYEDAGRVAFSIVMPTHNRAWCIGRAVASVMAQTHGNFELIIVDDGSTDGTRDLVEREFGEEIAAGRIRYVYLSENLGVCNARNVGLVHARNPWIAYADSDNVLRPYFLTLYANAIIEHRTRDAFYSQFINLSDGRTVGRPFDRKILVQSNFIDLGTFVHKRSLFTRFGGFDPELRRLVDWDLVIRYTKHKDPVFLYRVVLEYTDDQDHQDRISVRESLVKANLAVRSKHDSRPTVSTLILGYNHVDYITEAIESALAQKGNFTHEILLSDDGSTDGTARIMARYAEKHPTRIRNISRGGNHGISENYRHCFREAAGNFVAVLEGDDYWSDPEKNLRQAEFLTRTPEAQMVFSKIELLNMGNGSRRLLKRQEGLGPLLTGADFTKDENLNPLVNLSSAMFRTDLMRNLPSFLYEPRMSEIALAFHFDRMGKIGFLDRVMGVYRLNPASVWTGASRVSQLRQAVETRRGALRVARPAHRAAIERHLTEKLAQLRDAEDSQTRKPAA